MYNNDEGFISRQIKSLAKAISSLIFDKELPANIISEAGAITEDNFLAYRLNKLVNSGDINKAENLLFTEIEHYRSEANFKIALEFYEKLNELDENTLNKYNFSKQEIVDGLNEIKRIYEVFDESKKNSI